MGIFDLFKGKRAQTYVTEDKFRDNLERQLSMAPHTMENLKELGMPDESELKLDYFFYSNMLEKVSNLAEDLQKLDYDVSFGEDKAEPGLFIASGISTKISMNEFNVTNWVRRMCELGYIHDCDFDGWGTEPQQNKKPPFSTTQCNSKLKSDRLDYVPLIGIILFVLLYIYSSTLYPGGSQQDMESEGFDWIHNYWCNLMDHKAMNGQQNPARPLSVFAFTTLCISIGLFFIRFSQAFVKTSIWKRLIQVFGILSMTSAPFISTSFHHVAIIVACAFGLVVIIGIIRIIFQTQAKIL